MSNDARNSDEAHFTLKVDGTDYEVVRYHFTEAIGELYEGIFEVRFEGGAVSSLLNGSAEFTVEHGPDTAKRGGEVTGTRDLGTVAGVRLAEIRIEPRFARLHRGHNYRFFEKQKSSEIAATILREHGLPSHLSATQQTHDLCTQYGESDGAFIRRLLEEANFTTYFTHDGRERLLSIESGHAKSYPLLDPKRYRIMGQGGMTFQLPTIRDLERADLAGLSRHITIDNNALKGNRGVSTTKTDSASLPGTTEVIYPTTSAGHHAPLAAVFAELNATQSLNADLSARTVVTGTSNIVGFLPGHRFEAEDEDGNVTEYLLTRVVHRGAAPETLEHTSGSREEHVDRYSNTFECVPVTVPYTPPRRFPRPKVLAPETAVVVGTLESQTDTDHTGRVRVMFQWDSVNHGGKKRAEAHARVAQNWAGTHWGFLFLPRAGMEVVVHFLHGDPDRPVITGALYNDTQLPPKALPANRWTSYLRTSLQESTGNGYHEIVFHDEKGAEEVHLESARDLTELAFNDHLVEYKHDEVGTIGNDQTWTVTNNRTVTVKADDTLTVQKNRSVTITENDTLEVTKNLSVTVFAASTLTVTQTHTMSIDEGLTIKVGGNSGARLDMKPSSFKLTVSQHVIEMGPDGIKMTVGGTSLKLTAGGIEGVGNTIALSANITASLKGNASAELSASGMTTVKGGLVTIN